MRRLLPVLLAWPAAAAAAPIVLTHQGRLLDAAGAPLDGTHTLAVSLFDSETAPTARWTESATTSTPSGFYALVLGADPANPLEAEDFGAAGAWLAIAVDGQPAGGRVRLATTPYAARAAVAEAVDGGIVDASELRVGGATVIGTDGRIAVSRVTGAQARVSGACAVGTAIVAIAADGTVTCGEAGGRPPTPEVNANVAMPAQNTVVDGWGTLALSGITAGSGVSAVGSQLLFAAPGVYRITLDYRAGTGTDVWTGVRLVGGGLTRGMSAGYGVQGTGSPEVFGVTFLASVPDPSIPYELQLGRRGTAHQIGSPSAIGGQSMPALTATFERVDGLDVASAAYADLRAAAHSFAANAWTPIQFSSVGVAAGVSVSGTNVRFSESGTYWFDATYRIGTGGDVWSGFALFDGSTAVGRSVAYANLGASHEVFHPSFLADVVAGRDYTVRLGRLASTMTTDNPSNIGTEYLPSINVVATPVDPAAHAQLEGPGQTFPEGWNPISFTGAPVAAGISVSGADISFTEPGLYRIGVSHRNGTGADVWTGVRLVDQGGATRGVSTGYGNFSNSVELQAVQFLAQVVDTSAPHRLQIGRLGNSPLGVASPPAIVGVPAAGIVATITRVAP